eukprot:TRINITY_DN1173_c0_g1_i4.p1 TRINITY_DN1173_c0_g1~~TRINITY_DN1173_c0_g1_i4.p1  ORF type:complete len:219 (+),score=29.72 TRINITY_DN1173_c0_g1_i4:103-759(+)
MLSAQASKRGLRKEASWLEQSSDMQAQLEAAEAADNIWVWCAMRDELAKAPHNDKAVEHFTTFLDCSLSLHNADPAILWILSQIAVRTKDDNQQSTTSVLTTLSEHGLAADSNLYLASFLAIVGVDPITGDINAHLPTVASSNILQKEPWKPKPLNEITSHTEWVAYVSQARPLLLSNPKGRGLAHEEFRPLKKAERQSVASHRWRKISKLKMRFAFG